ncbi:putative transporter (transmembrane protein) [Halospina denitrificans]|uniref:Small-conductance mechanosensitive channel n=1 Tax=Halospina denitrificans TaxID=332522 RepID=A0A4R7K0B6_9GAMM|nr:mechanosensitive ion channel [Halospina denitrificans]TDT44270.1 putative transporter (transmembrane protein) [Halospina denitrificans]
METWSDFGQFIAQYGLNVLAAIVILVVGWIIAWVLSALVGRGLKHTSIHERIAEHVAGDETGAVQIENWTKRLVFAVLMLFVLIAVFEALLLQSVTGPLSEMLTVVLDYIPRIAGALVLILLAWGLATLLRAVLSRSIGAMRLDERLNETTEITHQGPTLAQTISNTVYWLVFLLFLPAVLGALELQGLLAPVETMLQKILNYLPNIAVAALIFVIGWLAARFVRRIVTQFLEAGRVNTLAERYGMTRALGDNYSAAQAVGTIVYILILLPVVVAGLHALQLDALTNPVQNVLAIILDAIPAIFAAAVLVTLAYFVGRFVSGLIAELLGATSFDRQMQKLGVRTEQVEETGGRTPSQLVGSLTLIAIMLFAAMEALSLLQFEHVAVLIADMLMFFGQVLVGLIVIGLGFFLANLAGNTIRANASQYAERLALIARVAIIALAIAMGLNQMGFGEEIINLAFGLVLGSVAVAAAIAFGLGGRDLAARELENWRGGGSKSSSGSTRKKST